MPAVRFFNVDYDSLHFQTFVKNKHFQSTLLGGREGITNKSTMCMLLKMLTILDDTLALSHLI